MTSMHDENIQGRRLLSAVERLIDDPESLVAYVEALEEDTVADEGAPREVIRRTIATRIISTYSNRSAFAGAATALPAIVPGGGTMIAVLGGSLADMALMLRHEVEMAMCLTYLYGHDIREERERWLAFLIASVSTYRAKSGRNYFLDLAEAELEAIARYTPRQLSKLVLTVMGKLALLALSRGLVKALPLVGVAVSASANKMLTESVGWRCVEALWRREKAGEVGGAMIEATVL